MIQMKLSLEGNLLNAAANLESADANSRFAAASSISQLMEDALYHQICVDSKLMISLSNLLLERCVKEVNTSVKYATLDALLALSSLSAFCGLSLNLRKLEENVDKFSAREKEPIALSFGYTKNPFYSRVLNEMAKENDKGLNEVVMDALKELNHHP